MINNCRFSDLHENIDYEGLDEWCQEYFQMSMAMLNAFLAKLEPAEVIERLKAVPFADMAVEQLENELDQVKEYAARRISELLTSELQYMEAYMKLGM